MEIKMITGCTANYLGIDGKSEVDMTDEQRINTWKHITHKLALKEPKGDDLNQLMQFCLHQWGEWDYGDVVCECCGDTVDIAIWNI
jgi:hypothetical protein